MFHDMGLEPSTTQQRHERFEVDGANAARDYFVAMGSLKMIYRIVSGPQLPCTRRRYSPAQHPLIAVVTAGVEMDVLGLTHAEV